MPILDLFSKKQKKLRGEVPDVYQYKELPQAFRVQVVHILRDALGDPNKYNSPTEKIFEILHNALSREYGVFHLSEEARRGEYQTAVFNFFLQNNNIEKTLDVIQIAFRLVQNIASEYGYRDRAGATITPEEAVAELNERFVEHGIGFQFEAGEILRVDSQFLHSDVVKPVLSVLSEKMYSGANEEFLSAHEHYRNKRYKECLNDCLKSFESVLKVICEKRKWKYNRNDTAKALLDCCFQNGLIPDYFQAQFTSLRSGLESGVPTVRNKLSGHGQGIEQRDVPQYIARYLLNLTATSILLLTDAEKALL